MAFGYYIVFDNDLCPNKKNIISVEHLHKTTILLEKPRGASFRPTE